MRLILTLAGPGLFAACGLTASALPADVTPVQPTFEAAAFAAPAPNRWHPLTPGVTRTFKGGTAEDPAIETVTVQGPGPVVLGVPTTAVLDEVREGDLLTERTLDYLATDRDGNVWYFGEDTEEYSYDDNDKRTGESSEGSWRAGVNDALPGILLPGGPATGGPALLQENAPREEAQDWGQVVATGQTLQTAAGTFSDVVKVLESSLGEPGSREYKYYAPDIGLIREEELAKGSDRVESTTDLQP